MLIDLKPLMTSEMFAELHYLAAAEPAELSIQLCAVAKDGYLPNSKYVGALTAGERVHRIDTEYGVSYVRSRCTATQLRKAFLTARR
jgi:hypothetical protein